MLQVEIQTRIPVDGLACELLNQMSSHANARIFVDRLAGRYSAEEIVRALNEVHAETAILLRARKAAVVAADRVIRSR